MKHTYHLWVSFKLINPKTKTVRTRHVKIIMHDIEPKELGLAILEANDMAGEIILNEHPDDISVHIDTHHHKDVEQSFRIAEYCVNHWIPNKK